MRMPKKQEESNQISKGYKKKSTTFQIKTHFVAHFIARMIRATVLRLCMVCFCLWLGSPKTHIVASKSRKREESGESVQKFMW